MKNVKDYEIKIEGETWTNALDKTFKNHNNNTKVDGFRKGKCPKEVFIKKFGIESLYMDAIDLVINEAYHKILTDNNLEPVIEPKVDIKNINENEVTLIFNVTTKPEVKLAKYKELGIKKERASVTEKDIDDEVLHMREHLADIVELTEGTLENTDTAIIDFTGFVDDKPLEHGDGKNYPLEIGSNTFIPGFEEGLIGMNVGETRTLNLKFPKEYVPELAEKDVKFEVTLHGIKKRILPEINKDFYLDLGYNDIKDETEFRAKVKENLLANKKTEIENKFVDELLEKITKEMTVEINDEIVDEEVNHFMKNMENDLKAKGLKLEQYLEYTHKSLDEYKEMIKPQAIQRIKERYALEEIIKLESITVAHEEIHTEAENIAKAYNITDEEVFQMIGGESVLEYELKMRKAIDVLKNNN